MKGGEMDLIFKISAIIVIPLAVLIYIYRFKAYSAAGETDEARGLLYNVVPRSTGWINEKSYSYYYKSQILFVLGFVLMWVELIYLVLFVI